MVWLGWSAVPPTPPSTADIWIGADHLAASVAGLEVANRLGGLGQRIASIHDRCDPAVLHPIVEEFEVGFPDLAENADKPLARETRAKRRL